MKYLHGFCPYRSRRLVPHEDDILEGDASTGPKTPTLNTWIRTIEGNTSETVRVRKRKISSITSIGSTR